MGNAIFWTKVFLRYFCRNVWRHNDYYWPGKRCSVRLAAFVAWDVARHCIDIRRSMK